MRLTLHSSPPAEVSADWLVVGVWENQSFSGTIDAKLGGLLSRLREQGDIAGKPKELTPIYQAAGIAATRLLLVGLGPCDQADYASLLSCAAAAAKMLSAKPVRRIAMAIPEGVP